MATYYQWAVNVPTQLERYPFYRSAENQTAVYQADTLLGILNSTAYPKYSTLTVSYNSTAGNAYEASTSRVYTTDGYWGHTSTTASSNTITTYRYPLFYPIVHLYLDIDLSENPDYRWRFPLTGGEIESELSLYSVGTITASEALYPPRTKRKMFMPPILNLHGHTIKNVVLGGTRGMFTGIRNRTTSPFYYYDNNSSVSYSARIKAISALNGFTTIYSPTTLPNYKVSAYRTGIYDGNLLNIYDGNGNFFTGCDFHDCTISIDASTASGKTPFTDCFFWNCSIYVKDEGVLPKTSIFDNCGGSGCDIYFDTARRETPTEALLSTEGTSSVFEEQKNWTKCRFWGYAKSKTTGTDTLNDCVWAVDCNFTEDGKVGDSASTGVYDKTLTTFGKALDTSSMIPATSVEIKSSVELRKKGFIVDQLTS